MVGIFCFWALKKMPIVCLVEQYKYLRFRLIEGSFASMERTIFTKDDSLIIKGLAILAIMLHNFFRWIGPTAYENEFGFTQDYAQQFCELLTNKPHEFINIIFGYLGHFGVQAFILLSGYGLTKSMLAKPQCWTAFMGVRLKKIYPLLIIAIAAFFAFTLALGYEMPEHSARETIFKLLFIHTLQPYSGLTMCGPWWFFGLIVQLYVLFPILLKLTQRHGTKILYGTTLLSYAWILIAIYFYDHDPHSLHAMQNAPGHLPEFCFGIWLALAPREISRWWLLPALAVFGLGNYFLPFYPFTFLAVSVIFVIGYNDVKGFIDKHLILKRPLVFFGSISMFLFVLQGFIRQPFIDWADGGSAIFKIGMAVAFFAVSIAASLALRPLYNFLVRLFDKIKFSECKIQKINRRVMSATLALLGFVAVHHATSIFQKHIEFEQNMQTKKCQFTTANTITPDTTFSSIARIYLFPCQFVKITVDAEIDSEGTPTDKLPLLVTDITLIHWDKFILPETDGYQKIHFEKNIYGSFLYHFVPKRINLYFWNNNKSSMKFRNAKVSIDYQNW